MVNLQKIWIVAAVVIALGAIACSDKDAEEITEIETIIGPEGGVAAGPDDVTMKIPPDALTKKVTFTIRKTRLEPTAFKKAGPVYEFTPHGTVFKKQVTVTVPYEPDSVDGIEDDLRLHWADNEEGPWERLTGAVDKTKKMVSGKTSHLSFGVAGISDEPMDTETESSTGLDSDSGSDTDTGISQDVPTTPDNLFFVAKSAMTSTPAVDMSFAPPPTLEATRYTLQSSDDNRATWQNFQYNFQDLTTDVFSDITQANNFSIDIGGDKWLRLLITGGPYDGLTSNEMPATSATIPAYVQESSLDESMANTGVMAPNVGYGLVAGFVIMNFSTGAVLSDAVTYQWYRVNPADYEDATAIPDATGLSYTTTTADRGYRLLIRADGNGVDFDGFSQQLSAWIVD